MQAQEHGSQVAMLRRPIEVGERFEPGTTRRVTGARVKCECKIEWYSHHALIDDRQRDAGLKFRIDWTIGTAEPRVTASYAQNVAGRADYSEERLAARRRITASLRALDGTAAATSYRRVIIAVCGQDEWAGGTSTLREALNMLAHHYRLPIGG